MKKLSIFIPLLLSACGAGNTSLTTYTNDTLQKALKPALECVGTNLDGYTIGFSSELGKEENQQIYGQLKGKQVVLHNVLDPEKKLDAIPNQLFALSYVLAHELTHVGQEKRGIDLATEKDKPHDTRSYEIEANNVGSICTQEIYSILSPER